MKLIFRPHYTAYRNVTFGDADANNDSQTRKATMKDRQIKGKAIVVSNHTGFMDYPALIFAFPWRTIRCQMAEVLFKKPFLSGFLRLMGGIRVDRTSKSMDFLTKSEKILSKGGVVAIFPEGRIPKKGETTPLRFTESAVLLALTTDTPVIPVSTNGKYFTKEAERMTIGGPLDLTNWVDPALDERANVAAITERLREYIAKMRTDGRKI